MSRLRVFLARPDNDKYEAPEGCCGHCQIILLRRMNSDCSEQSDCAADVKNVDDSDLRGCPEM